MARVAKPVLAGWLALLLLGGQAAAVSPDLHHWFHDDAGGANHDCAAVLLQKGFAESAPSVAVAPALPSAGDVRPGPDPAVPFVRLPTRPPERAPPLA